MKSLRSTGSDEAARASRRSSSEPPKWNGSVRIESAAAPPRSYARTTSPTSLPLRIFPAEGERRLCSAISEMPGRVSASENGRKPSARRSICFSSCFSETSLRRRFTSSRVSSTIRSSTLMGDHRRRGEGRYGGRFDHRFADAHAATTPE